MMISVLLNYVIEEEIFFVDNSRVDLCVKFIRMLTIQTFGIRSKN